MARKNPVGANRMTKQDMPYDTQGMDADMASTLTGESRRVAAVGRMTGTDTFGDQNKTVPHNMFKDVMDEIKRRFMGQAKPK
jgi:hypothetical protein